MTAVELPATPPVIPDSVRTSAEWRVWAEAVLLIREYLAWAEEDAA
jgi:hypothetical protein